MATGTTPVLDAAAEINAVSLSRTDLDPRSLMIARIAALVAVDAPVGSYLLHVGPAAEVGLTVDDVEDVLVAVAPIVGTPRLLASARKIAEAFDLAIQIGAEDDIQ
ncbi:MAG: carboxymuconolactone decarboxylase family protein [Cryobacterium sp.]